MSEKINTHHIKDGEKESPFGCMRWMSRMMGDDEVDDKRGGANFAERSAKSELARKLDGVGWGLFFIWVGAVLLADIETGGALLGVGIITLGVQATRKLLALRTEGFWLVVGTGFLLGGIWHLADTNLPLLPLVAIVAGLAVLLTSIFPKGRPEGTG
jgi:hypothetical protein